ncbi:pyridoxamine 5'-phosphate oxidase family protein [Clostridium sp. JS66]|uniref:pyridoxamine 5'-phosphate oxidase family protein n=1 Tax=Clostridium sp. JS66 TaxID=3064705 RepID=UPI00298E5ACE|nr:pyridoxamine 5'-phosphate oxidase family protein [Clostridium sp. JS66]WPC44274.1 pyridoxamine 5'-phosphate oxidase family protein [Clostridium sp. JS66]
MLKEQIFELMRKHPVFFLATVEEDQPRVRGMLLYRADEDGIIFHTAVTKDVYNQVLKNPKAELCFCENGTQIRISGKLEIVDDNNLKDEISEHPTRKFLKPWRESGDLKDFYNSFAVLKLRNGAATIWTMEKNFAPKEMIQL